MLLIDGHIVQYSISVRRIAELSVMVPLYAVICLPSYASLILSSMFSIGIIGTQDLSDSHQNLIELLSYALVLSGNHIYTSGNVSKV